MPAELRYRAAAVADLAWVELDELTVVFDRRSGQSHLLAQPLPEMLAAMGDGEWTCADVNARLADQFDLTGEGSLGERVAERLTELVAMGLVEAR